MKKYMFVITMIILLIAACSKSSVDSSFTEDCTGTAKSFATDVNPIVQSRCATNSSCHGAGSNNGPGELLTYAQVFTVQATIRAAVISGEMPQGSSLSSAQKNNIACWIDNGAPNN